MSHVVETAGVRFIRTDDMILEHQERTGRPFEADTWAWMQRVLPQDPGLAIDIGASTGWYTVRLAMLGHRVLAFEPNPAPLARLDLNVDLNGVGHRVDARAAAVSDHCGRSTLWTNPRVPLTSGGSIAAPTCARPISQDVDTVTLDAALAGIGDPRPALIKVDVENHEAAVLRGARATLARHRPPLVLEANSRALETGLRAMLGPLGYRIEQADERNLLCTPEDNA